MDFFSLRNLPDSKRTAWFGLNSRSFHIILKTNKGIFNEWFRDGCFVDAWSLMFFVSDCFLF